MLLLVRLDLDTLAGLIDAPRQRRDPGRRFRQPGLLRKRVVLDVSEGREVAPIAPWAGDRIG